MQSLQRMICGLRGHEAVLHFEPHRLSLRCLSCGHETTGWSLQPETRREAPLTNDVLAESYERTWKDRDVHQCLSEPPKSFASRSDVTATRASKLLVRTGQRARSLTARRTWSIGWSTI